MPKLPARLKPTLVGELNPYGSDPDMALVPFPVGCSGHRLCCKVLGMCRAVYMDSFARVNLCDDEWVVGEARARAKSLWEQPAGKFILLGAKVCRAWQTPFEPFAVSDGGRTLVLPHPSGLCRLWNVPGNFLRARRVVAEFCPHLAPLMRTAP